MLFSVQLQRLKKRPWLTGLLIAPAGTAISLGRFLTRNPLGLLTDYSKENKSKIVFPGGLVIEEETAVVAWGKADRQVCITVFDKKKLFSSMQACQD